MFNIIEGNLAFRNGQAQIVLDNRLALLMDDHNFSSVFQGFRHFKVKCKLNIRFNLLAFAARSNDLALFIGVITHGLEGDLIGQAVKNLHDLKADSLGFIVNINCVDQLCDFIVENLLVFADQLNL